jgi:hypothetical protein
VNGTDVWPFVYVIRFSHDYSILNILVSTFSVHGRTQLWLKLEQNNIKESDFSPLLFTFNHLPLHNASTIKLPQKIKLPGISEYTPTSSSFYDYLSSKKLTNLEYHHHALLSRHGVLYPCGWSSRPRRAFPFH